MKRCYSIVSSSSPTILLLFLTLATTAEINLIAGGKVVRKMTLSIHACLTFFFCSSLSFSLLALIILTGLVYRIEVSFVVYFLINFPQLKFRKTLFIFPRFCLNIVHKTVFIGQLESISKIILFNHSN